MPLSLLPRKPATAHDERLNPPLICVELDVERNDDRFGSNRARVLDQASLTGSPDLQEWLRGRRVLRTPAADEKRTTQNARGSI